MKLQLLYSFLLLLVYASTAPDNKGTEFIIAFTPNYQDNTNLALFLSSEENCTGTSLFCFSTKNSSFAVEISSPAWSTQTVNIPAMSTITVALPYATTVA
jgi:hypothetical protein